MRLATRVRYVIFLVGFPPLNTIKIIAQVPISGLSHSHFIVCNIVIVDGFWKRSEVSVQGTSIFNTKERLVSNGRDIGE